MQYSISQAGNIAAVAGILSMVAAHYGLSFITTADIQTLVGGVLVVGGVLISWYDQYKSGLTTATGFRTGAAVAIKAAEPAKTPFPELEK